MRTAPSVAGLFSAVLWTSTAGAAPVDGGRLERPADVRLVVTGGLGGLHDGYDRFWSSSLFRAGQGLPLTIEDAHASVVRYGDDLFVSWAAGDDGTAHLRRAAGAGDKVERTLHRVLQGAGVIAFAADAKPLTGPPADFLERALGAVPRLVAIERRPLGANLEEGRPSAAGYVYGIDFSPHDPLVWPGPASPLTEVPAARASLATLDEPQPLFLVARPRGATARVLGTLDLLLADRSVPTLYVDAGEALTTGAEMSLAAAPAVKELLLRRGPRALGTGLAEMAVRLAQPSILDDAPYLSAAEGGAMPPVTRTARAGPRSVLFCAVGDEGPRWTGLLPGGARPLDARATARLAAEAARAAGPDLVIGLAHTATGAQAALEAAAFDAVLRLVDDGASTLPASDDIVLTENHRAGLHPGPTLVRVASDSVSEVRFWLTDDDGAGGPRVDRVRIDRHLVTVERPAADDALAKVVELATTKRREGGLPPRASVAHSQRATWTGAELSQLRAELIRRRVDAEVAILPTVGEPLDVRGAVPAALTRAWLGGGERVLVTWLRGQQLLPLFGALKRLGASFTVAGASLDASTVAKRGIAPLEYYRVALTSWAVVALGNEGLRLPLDADEESEDAARAPTLIELVDEALPRLADAAYVEDLLLSEGGKPTHAFFVEVQDLALSGSAHGIRGNENLTAVRDARIQTPPNFSLGISGKLSALYDGPWNEASVSAQSRLNHVEKLNPDNSVVITEAIDVLLFEADARLKLVQLLPWDQAATLLPRPTVRVSYQTEWTPNVVVIEGEEVTQPRRSELRGLVGLGLSPRPWLSDIRLGVLVENDFATPTAGALEWGGEAALSGKWSYEVFLFSVDAFARVYAPDPGRDTADDVGLVTQMIGRVEVPVIFDFGIGAFVDVYLARGKIEETRGPVGSVIVGASLSYGQRLKWVPFR